MADAQALLQLQAFVDGALQGRTDLRILDAGCGSSSYVRAPETAYRVGIDISEEQLRKNTFVDEKILGDIQEYELPSASFDVIICWWVLEHLREPTKVLSGFRDALRENGLMVLAVPNVLSMKGLATKLTPFWFHVWVYQLCTATKWRARQDTLRFERGCGSLSPQTPSAALRTRADYLWTISTCSRMKESSG